MDAKTCGCGHRERDHFPACLAELRRTTNRYGGGTTTLCGCPNFGSPAGAALGRRRVRRVLRLVEAELARAQAGHGPMVSDREGRDVIAEEFDEFTRAVWFGLDQRGQSSNPHDEAIQLAAMAVRFLIDVPRDEAG